MHVRLTKLLLIIIVQIEIFNQHALVNNFSVMPCYVLHTDAIYRSLLNYTESVFSKINNFFLIFRNQKSV